MKLTLFILLINFTLSFGQNFFTWKNFTDMRNLKDAKLTKEQALCATDGGFFIFNFKDSTYSVFTKSEGLQSQNITAVAIDNEGKIWLGSVEGYINVINPNTNEIKTIIDIATSDKKNKGVNDLQVKGDTVFVSTDFGISLISTKDYHFYDTVTKFGNFPTETKVNSVTLEKTITVSTLKGVAFLKTGVTNYAAPESWQTFEFDSNFFARNVYKTLYFQGFYYAATDTGLFRLKNNQWQRILYANYHVNDFAVFEDTLFSIVGQKVFKYDGNTSTAVVNFPDYRLRKLVRNQNGLFVASDNGLLVITNNGTLKIFPNGPVQNSMHKLTVDSRGRLWTVSGKSPYGSGINMFDGSQWSNFSKENVPAITLNAFYSVYAAKDGRVFFANWGNGFTVFQDDSFYTYNADNTTLTGISVNPHFIPLTDIALDSKGNIWVLNLSNLNSQPISVMTTDGSWYHYKFGYPLTPSQAGVYHLAIDQYDTKWFAVQFDGEPGLYYFNENKTFDETDDDVWGILTTSDGLNSDKINAVVLDKAGELWIGTGLGVNYLAEPGSPHSRIGSVFSLRQQNITCIAVDPLNRKWIGTNQGVFLISPDGSSLLANYTVRNSPLASNNINSIAINEETGVVYIATDFGLSSLKTMGIKPQKEFRDIFVYPNPFVISAGKTNRVFIKGLIQNSYVKIFSPSGKLVRSYLSYPGGNIAVWDGRDNDGNLVSSGVYIISLYDEEANNVALTKIAVIRK